LGKIKEKAEACAQRRDHRFKSTNVEAFKSFKRQTEEAESRLKAKKGQEKEISAVAYQAA